MFPPRQGQAPAGGRRRGDRFRGPREARGGTLLYEAKVSGPRGAGSRGLGPIPRLPSGTPRPRR